MKNLKHLGFLTLSLSLFAGLAGCAHSVPQRAHESAREGAFVDASAANARGGLGNYASRICSDGGWGFPSHDCASAPERADKKKTHAAGAPVAATPVVANPFAAAKGEKPSIRLDVQFNSGSSDLTSQESAELNQIATTLKDNPKLKIQVEGHTDSAGVAAKNQALSERRATRVREYLVGQGVAAGQVTAKGFGSSQPIAQNTSPSGRAKNRRVMATVVTQ
jgi:outer membrane protein OmpA-like peptidoglycan-associated protein